MASIFPKTLSRNSEALTAAQQQILTSSHIAVIGCGGLGGYVIEELARIGIGWLTIYDPDTFSPSNCNRQINALNSTQGKNKAEVAAQRILDMGTGCIPKAIPFDYRDHLPKKKHDIGVVIDCLDSIETRFHLSDLCNTLAIPLVHGAVTSWYGQLGVQLPGFNLAAAIFPAKTNQSAEQSPPSVLSFTVATIASLQACEAVKLLLGIPSPLHNNWAQIDLKHNTFDYMPATHP
ncbi:HesA/MoeB/ThiF family protein [Desulfogranum marinum]|uniref:HesA/MoeB/ThiF family protein n=1 Tax=Desulfogranum marinum TaxID=453220 RepID=UPI0029C6FD08|nr:HesA/MoeB/ThiF family protein [Desulfogranum marinum]